MSEHQGQRIVRLEETKRLARVLRIMQLIGAQPRAWTRRRLAERFELSERMIAKDLDVIRYGLCLDLQHAREGYYFVRGPLVRPIELTVPEALALALSAQQARDTGSVDAAVIGGALRLLEEALPDGIVPYLRAAQGTPAPFPPVRERGPMLALLERAMAEGRRVAIEYVTASRDGAHSRRTIAPYYLQPYERSWIAIAQDSRRDEIRMFKVDRIEWGELTDERYNVSGNFDPVAYLGDAWGVLRGIAGPAEDVVLQFSAQAGRWVCDERWHPSQHMEWLPSGELLLRFHCEVTPELVRWVLSFGAEVRVELPAELRKKVIEEATRMVFRQRGSEE